MIILIITCCLFSFTVALAFLFIEKNNLLLKEVCNNVEAGAVIAVSLLHFFSPFFPKSISIEVPKEVSRPFLQ
jgi:hypothetical protein